MVVDYVKDFGVNADKAAKYLVSQAVEKGSQDNVSVVIVFFEEGPLVTSCKSGLKLRRLVSRAKKGIKKLTSRERSETEREWCKE